MRACVRQEAVGRKAFIGGSTGDGAHSGLGTALTLWGPRSVRVHHHRRVVHAVGIVLAAAGHAQQRLQRGCKLQRRGRGGRGRGVSGGWVVGWEVGGHTRDTRPPSAAPPPPAPRPARRLTSMCDTSALLSLGSGHSLGLEYTMGILEPSSYLQSVWRSVQGGAERAGSSEGGKVREGMRPTAQTRCSQVAPRPTC